MDDIDKQTGTDEAKTTKMKNKNTNRKYVLNLRQ